MKLSATQELLLAFGLVVALFSGGFYLLAMKERAFRADCRAVGGVPAATGPKSATLCLAPNSTVEVAL